MSDIVIVTGGRDFRQMFDVDTVLHDLQPYMVVHGDCPTGADKFAKNWAVRAQRPYLSWPAKWKDLGKRAGPARNKVMAEWIVRHSGRSNVVCVYFPGGSGTENCKTVCKNLGISVVDGTEYARQIDEAITGNWE